MDLLFAREAQEAFEQMSLAPGDEGWRTMPNGTRVQIGRSGSITKGPGALKGAKVPKGTVDAPILTRSPNGEVHRLASPEAREKSAKAKDEQRAASREKRLKDRMASDNEFAQARKADAQARIAKTRSKMASDGRFRDRSKDPERQGARMSRRERELADRAAKNAEAAKRNDERAAQRKLDAKAATAKAKSKLAGDKFDQLQKDGKSSQADLELQKMKANLSPKQQMDRVRAMAAQTAKSAPKTQKTPDQQLASMKAKLTPQELQARGRAKIDRLKAEKQRQVAASQPKKTPAQQLADMKDKVARENGNKPPMQVKPRPAPQAIKPPKRTAPKKTEPGKIPMPKAKPSADDPVARAAAIKGLDSRLANAGVPPNARARIKALGEFSVVQQRRAGDQLLSLQKAQRPLISQRNDLLRQLRDGKGNPKKLQRRIRMLQYEIEGIGRQAGAVLKKADGELAQRRYMQNKLAKAGVRPSEIRKIHQIATDGDMKLAARVANYSISQRQSQRDRVRSNLVGAGAANTDKAKRLVARREKVRARARRLADFRTEEAPKKLARAAEESVYLTEARKQGKSVLAPGDTGWRTMANGTKVQIGKDGTIVKGPKGLKGEKAPKGSIDPQPPKPAAPWAPGQKPHPSKMNEDQVRFNHGRLLGNMANKFKPGTLGHAAAKAELEATQARAKQLGVKLGQDAMDKPPLSKNPKIAAVRAKAQARRDAEAEARREAERLAKEKEAERSATVRDQNSPDKWDAALKADAEKKAGTDEDRFLGKSEWDFKGSDKDAKAKYDAERAAAARKANDPDEWRKAIDKKLDSDFEQRVAKEGRSEASVSIGDLKMSRAEFEKKLDAGEFNNGLKAYEADLRRGVDTLQKRTDEIRARMNEKYQALEKEHASTQDALDRVDNSVGRPSAMRNAPAAYHLIDAIVRYQNGSLAEDAKLPKTAKEFDALIRTTVSKLGSKKDYEAVYELEKVFGEASTTNSMPHNAYRAIKRFVDDNPGQVPTLERAGISKDVDVLLKGIPAYKEAVGKIASEFSNDLAQNNRRINRMRAELETLNRGVQRKPEKGGHWGAAEDGNFTAEAVAFAGGKQWRPINRGITRADNEVSVAQAVKGINLRQYAQQRVAQTPRSEHPEVYRGMSLPRETVDAIVNGSLKEVRLTGVTALSFRQDIAEHYATSTWTAQKAAAAGQSAPKPVLITVRRSHQFDRTIGMWHEDNGQGAGRRGADKAPAFEILSTADRFKIVSVTSSENGITRITVEAD